jgi:hypothetical protein
VLVRDAAPLEHWDVRVAFVTLSIVFSTSSQVCNVGALVLVSFRAVPDQNTIPSAFINDAAVRWHGELVKELDTPVISAANPLVTAAELFAVSTTSISCVR